MLSNEEKRILRRKCQREKGMKKKRIESYVSWVEDWIKKICKD